MSWLLLAIGFIAVAVVLTVCFLMFIEIWKNCPWHYQRPSVQNDHSIVCDSVVIHSTFIENHNQILCQNGVLSENVINNPNNSSPTEVTIHRLNEHGLPSYSEAVGPSNAEPTYNIRENDIPPPPYEDL